MKSIDYLTKSTDYLTCQVKSLGKQLKTPPAPPTTKDCKSALKRSGTQKPSPLQAVKVAFVEHNVPPWRGPGLTPLLNPNKTCLRMSRTNLVLLHQVPQQQLLGSKSLHQNPHSHTWWSWACSTQQEKGKSQPKMTEKGSCNAYHCSHNHSGKSCGISHFSQSTLYDDSTMLQFCCCQSQYPLC